MSPHPQHGWPSRAMAAVLSAAVFLSSFGPGTPVLAADLHIGTPEAGAAESGAAKVQPIALAPSLFSPSLSAGAPSLSAPAPVPSAALPVLGGHARPLAAAAAPPRLEPAAGV